MLDYLLKERIKPLNILEMLIHTEKWLNLSKLFHTPSGKDSKIANLLILYNVDAMTRIFNELIAVCHPIDKEVLQAFAPYRTEHINRFGSYALDMDREVKPLNHKINWI